MASITGGVGNVEKPIQDRMQVDKHKNTSSKKVVNSNNPNNFAQLLKSNKVEFNNSAISKQEQIKRVLDSHKKNSQKSIVPNSSNMDALIKAGGLTREQIEELIVKENKLANSSRKDVLTNSKISNDRIGTNLALKRLAKEMEVQIMGFFYTLIDNTREINHQGGTAERVFRGDYISKLVESGSDEELGEIGRAIYNNLVREDSVKGQKSDR